MVLWRRADERDVREKTGAAHDRAARRTAQGPGLRRLYPRQFVAKYFVEHADQFPDSLDRNAEVRRQKTVVPDLHEPGRQNMLKIPPDELEGRQFNLSPS